MISQAAIERLTMVYRVLEEFQETGKTGTSSSELAGLLGLTAATVRKDISYISEPGTGSSPGATSSGGAGGSGYQVAVLRKAIAAALGLGKPMKACVAGLGRLGSAILNFGGFIPAGFTLEAAFDSSANRLELLTTPVPLYQASRIPEIVREKGISLGIITVPAKAAQETADKFMAGGIRGIVNFSPVILRVKDPEVMVRNVFVVGEFRILQAFLHLAGLGRTENTE
jgi:redox-sensing transcriptional repressor